MNGLTHDNILGVGNHLAFNPRKMIICMSLCMIITCKIDLSWYYNIKFRKLLAAQEGKICDVAVTVRFV